MLFDKRLFTLGSEHGVSLRNTIQATMRAGVRSQVDPDTGYDSDIDGDIKMGSCTDNRIRYIYDVQQSDKEDAEMTFSFYPYGTGRNNVYSFEYGLVIDGVRVLERGRGVVWFSHPPSNLTDGGVSDTRCFETFDIDGPMFAYKYRPKSDGYFYGFDCVQCVWPNLFPDEWKEWLLSGVTSEAHHIGFTTEFFDGKKKFGVFDPPADGAKVFLPFGFQANESYDIVVNYSDPLWQAGVGGVNT